MTAKTVLGRSRQISNAARVAVAAIVIAGVAGVGASALGREGSSGDLTPAPSGSELTAAAAVDVGASEEFTGITPCRILDTRPATPITATMRSFDVTGLLDSQGGSNACGIPATATSVVVNLTGISVGGSTGFVRGWAAGDAPVNATLLNFSPALNASNVVTIPACTGTSCTDAFTLQVFGSAHLVGDAVGYYQAPLYALVEGDGTVDTSVSSGVVASETWRADTGRYIVTFERPIDNCAVVATNAVEGWGFAVGAFGSASEGTASAQVFVTDSTDNPADTSFYLTVHC